MDVLNCDNIAGVVVMSADVSIECVSTEYKALRVFSVVGLLIYTFAYMAFVVLMMFSLFRRQAFSDPSNIRRFGFLYTKVELDYLWMEVISLAVRITFVAVSVFIGDTLSAAASLAVVTMLWLLLHVYSAPYIQSELDVLQSFLVVSLLALAFGGLMFFNPKLGAGKRRVLEKGILAVLALMWVSFCALFVKEIVGKVQILEPRTGPWLRGAGVPISTELYDTFKAGFIYRALKNADAELLMDWEELSQMLADWMSNDSFTSYLSLEVVARFWRKLVGGFPEIVDFLAIADEESLTHFREFIEVLYKDFYVKKHVQSRSLHGHLNWKDRGPMALWLAMAPIQDRAFFAGFMTEAFKRVHGAQAEASLKARMRSQLSKILDCCM
ncbi:unnamed protein product [Ostreobium quekettii]|uniref:Uncharacterized protein n=1 Tax=Ostreobium quekettii TaxID=121088 RepID=A0A8S1JDY4_9CHLO|nr:unnamed protein product [Ostreobium quekettii]